LGQAIALGGLFMLPSQNVGIGKNIVIGLLFFVIVAIGCGFGSFIAVIAATDEFAIFGIIGSMMIIFSGPLIALIAGIVQGKKANNGGEALIAGGVAGIVGYILLLFIVSIIIASAIAIRFPPSDNGNGSVSFGLDMGELISQWIAIFLPSGIIGAFSALISRKMVFQQPSQILPPSQEPSTMFPVIEEPPLMPQLKQQYTPSYNQKQVYDQRQYQQVSQQQQQFTISDCPYCGKPFKTHRSDRPQRVTCPSCGHGVIVGI
jgi:MFS family permease/DNA-directed RNA polymerase subunit RPC12/RpoP